MIKRSKCVAFNADIGSADVNGAPNMLTAILLSYPTSPASALGSNSFTA